ncbi:MAG: hypothetical protein KF889_19225 [Alphaproteobacteria bacterium]|nr:hypothetical protein [Alphaproteobacteria bacterium]MCW5744093.1 hypothetical protein [Alphaproteobacteria bacterium]
MAAWTGPRQDDHPAPLSCFDVVGAVGGVFQSSMAAGASVGAKYWQFGNRDGMSMQYAGPSVEAKIAVSIEPLNVAGGAHFPFSLEFDYVRLREFVHMRDTRPGQNFRFAPGKSEARRASETSKGLRPFAVRHIGRAPVGEFVRRFRRPACTLICDTKGRLAHLVHEVDDVTARIERRSSVADDRTTNAAAP